MMQRLGKDLNRSTRAFSTLVRSEDQDGGEINLHGPSLLDVCMAPGGFSKYFLAVHPRGQVKGFSLPRSSGGHELLINPSDPRVKVQFTDITLMAAEMDVDVSMIVSEHPDKSRFHTTRPYQHDQFELAICDGQVLRTHERPTYRESNEAPRLLFSQLVLAMQRIKQNGSIIVLLHKLEQARTMKLLYTFNKFSRVELFKSSKSHAIRSSFYMVAKEVQPQSPDALEAVELWKESWRVLSFRGKAEYSNQSTEETRKMLEEFGDRLIRLGTPVWETQWCALSKTTFCN
jgi:23S rRNA U2552 (ribose-2'-O)-methylase RlmE/FtsJ